MASVNINVTNFQTWENTGIAAPCLVESHSGDVFVAIATTIEDLDEVDGIPLIQPFSRTTLEAATGTIWYKSYIRNSSISITPF